MRTALRPNAVEAEQAPEPPAERRLSGHSGALVVLHSSGRDSFVRKTAITADQSGRLKAQADKQHSLWMFGLPFPRVRSQAVDAAGIGSFDMHYIPGRTIADAILQGGTFDPAAVVKAVERLMWFFTTRSGPALPRALFESKIAQISRNAAGMIADRALRHRIGNCGQLLMVQDWTDIPQSPCHGDLTLENILLTSGKSIAFIDCDEAFASSFWLDFGKLFQDIEGHWCLRGLYRHPDNSVALLNAAQKLETLGARFRALATDLDDRLAARLPQLSALGLYRAIPYAQDEALASFLCRRIEQLLQG